MNNLPLVSVIMPIFNGEKTVELAFKSLFIQTYKNWQCVVVDDGSTDGTKQILSGYESDERFKIIYSEKNRGRGAARQIAKSNADGEYIAYLDADDFYHANKLEQQVSVLIKHRDVSLVASGLASFDNEQKLRNVQVEDKQMSILYNPDGKLKINCATCMIRVVDILNIDYNLKLNSSEDIDFFQRALIYKKYIVLNRILYYYSEYKSVTKRKLIAYSLMALKSSFMKCNFLNYQNLRSFLLSFLRVIYYLLFISFVKTDFFIDRRTGKRKPTFTESDDFDKIKTNLFNNE